MITCFYKGKISLCFDEKNVYLCEGINEIKSVFFALFDKMTNLLK